MERGKEDVREGGRETNNLVRPIYLSATMWMRKVYVHSSILCRYETVKFSSF